MNVQVYRLWPRRPRDGSLPLGLSCDEEGRDCSSAGFVNSSGLRWMNSAESFIAFGRSARSMQF